MTEYMIVDPKQAEVLNDYGDERMTVISSCTDDRTMRQVVVGTLK